MKYWFATPLYKTVAIAGAALIGWNAGMAPSLAGDPFRTENPHAISEVTENAFLAVFQDGNYMQAEAILKEAVDRGSTEPLDYALLASFAYIEENYDDFAYYGTRTREIAQRSIETDPLRGNLYVAVGLFFEGAYAILENGVVSGTPTALRKLPQVFRHLDKAESVASEDPEFSLIRGYMDLMLAVNLPFASADWAIERLENNGEPKYLAYRGIAIGYRDLDEEDSALSYTDRALAILPENPDLLYLKAQVLVKQGNSRASLEYFEKSLSKKEQMLPGLRKQIEFEHCRAEKKVKQEDRSQCHELL